MITDVAVRWVSHKSLQSACKMIPQVAPVADEWTSSSDVSCNSWGYQPPVCTHGTELYLFCDSSINSLMTCSFDQTEKKKKNPKHSSSLWTHCPMCDDIQAYESLSHFSGLQILKSSGVLRLTVLPLIRLQGKAVFVALQEGEIRWCLTVALQAHLRGIKKSAATSCLLSRPHISFFFLVFLCPFSVNFQQHSLSSQTDDTWWCADKISTAASLCCLFTFSAPCFLCV